MNTREDRLSKLMMGIPPSGIRKFFEMLIGHDDVISLSVGERHFIILKRGIHRIHQTGD